MRRTPSIITGAVKALVLALAFGVAAVSIAASPSTAQARSSKVPSCSSKSNGTHVGERLVGTLRSDCLRGGGGRDRIYAKAGADTLLARDGRIDMIRCGAGRDTAFVDRRDKVSGCEDEVFSVNPGGGTDADGKGSESIVPESPCEVPLAGLTEGVCGLELDDPGTEADPNPIWGLIDCEQAARHSFLFGGADLSPFGGTAPADDSYRRLTVLDGDDEWGERCELGLNNNVRGPTTLYREGERKLTNFSLRLAEDFPLTTQEWQVVMQMKQAQPAANSGGTPAISLLALNGQWRLQRSSSSGPSSGSELLWSAPAETGRWTRFSFDVNYSQDPAVGWIKVYVDLNGDGDSLDPHEQSSTINTYTLKRETVGGSATDGIAPGTSIPAHLRIGPYHDSSIACPAPTGCSLDVDNVQVVEPL